MEAFPAYFPLAGRRVVIAGEGEGALAKARLFEGSPAQVIRLTDAEAGEMARGVASAVTLMPSCFARRMSSTECAELMCCMWMCAPV